MIIGSIQDVTIDLLLRNQMNDMGIDRLCGTRVPGNSDEDKIWRRHIGVGLDVGLG